MGLRGKISRALIGLSVVLFSAWLFIHDEAAQPGPLSPSHRELDDCTYCHIPWKGVSEERCLECHEFTNVTSLPKLVRFHEAKEKCLHCHQEHGLLEKGISRMDHTILNEALLCSLCHFDPHRSRFGEDCRDCHGIFSWEIAGYRHPAGDRKDCSRCHRPPDFHEDKRYWQVILESKGVEKATPEECWRCHTINHWPHLRETTGW